ncbi:MAG: tetratricopeptide repeat protein [bacterium]|nr:tetratricopeptide repeat protein [bacterium]
MIAIDVKNNRQIVLGKYRLMPWQGCFLLLLLIYAVVILATFTDYGITTDEGHHIEYGYSVVRWYASVFQERWVFSWADVWLYGGLYDTVSFLAIQVSPLDLYDTRHLCNAAVGILGVVIAYKLGCVLGGGWTGVLAAVFLVLTPRYYGHAFNNHKDLPFAVFFLWGLYGIVRSMEALPGVSWRRLLWVGLAIGCAMGVRVGGMMLMGIAGLFWGVRYLQLWLEDHSSFWPLLGRYARQVGLVFGVGYGVMLLCWPWAQTNPLVHPFKALTVFSRFPGRHMNFFEGRYFRNTEIPWYYAPKWLLLTLPEFVFLGLLAGSACLIFRMLRAGPDDRLLQVAIPVFGALFPLAYLVVTGTPLYSGARHFLFVVPPLIILSAVGVVQVSRWLRGKWPIGLWLVVSGLLVHTLFEMVTLHPNQYVYFNRMVAGGLLQASKLYDVEYWDNSYRIGVRWLESIFQSPSEYKWRIAAEAASTRHLLDPDRFAYVRNPWEADFYLVPTYGNTHRLVPGEVLHVVQARGVPLLYVIRPDSSYGDDPLFDPSKHPSYESSMGGLYRMVGQTEAAVGMYEKALKRYPNSSFSYIDLAYVYVDVGRIETAIELFQTGFEMGFEDAVAFKDLALLYLNREAYEKAISFYERSLAMRPNYLGALRGLASAYSKVDRHKEALEMMSRVLKMDPESHPAQRNLGVIFYYAGQVDRAIEIYRDLLKYDPNSPDLYFDLGAALQKQGRSVEAAEAYREVLRLNSGHPQAYLNLGLIYLAGEHFEAAAQVFQQATVVDPENWKAFQGLGQAFERLNRIEWAIGAYREVLRLYPKQAQARARLDVLTK